MAEFSLVVSLGPCGKTVPYAAPRVRLNFENPGVYRLWITAGWSM